jgi:hypothetical protein
VLLSKPHEYRRWLDHTATYTDFKKEMWDETQIDQRTAVNRSTQRLVQRIEIGREVIKIVFRVTPDARGSGPESIVVTLSRV